MKTIDTLVEDIYAVVQGNGGWDNTVSKFFSEELGKVLERRFTPSSTPYTPTLRMSNIGTPCRRKLWYALNLPTASSPPSPANTLKFLYGDILEALLLSLAKAAGHTVEGEQDRLEFNGIKGSRDCVIDGVTVDIKSASSNAMKKFTKKGSLRTDDPFGYLRQLSGYVAAAQDDPLVKDKTRGAFLAVDKQHGTLVLDVYDFTEEIADMEDYTNKLREEVKDTTPPPKKYWDVPEGKSGNRKLDTPCVFCEFKSVCWPKLRAFRYSFGDVFLTEVVREPDKRIMEVPLE